MCNVLNSRLVDGTRAKEVDAKRLNEALRRMSDAELDALADDLDFCNFAGLASCLLYTSDAADE